MPLTSQPTKTDQPSATGIGRVKSNAFAITDRDVQDDADEHEKIKDYVIDVCGEVGNHVGTTGDLNTRVDALENASVSLSYGAATSIGAHVNSDGVSTDVSRADHKHAVALAIVAVNANVTLGVGDGVLVVNTTTSRNIQLPSPAGLVGLLPVLLIDKNNNTESAPINLVRAAAEKIDNATSTRVLSANGGRWWLFTDGTDWYTAQCAPVGLTTSSPSNVNRSAAQVGTGTFAAREDHKHDINTAAAVAISGRANAAGAQTSLAISDHTHAIALGVQTFTADGTIATTTGVCLVDNGAGGRALTLPDPAAVNAFLPIWLIHYAGTSTAISLVRHAAEKIDGVANTRFLQGVADHNDRYFVWTDGTDWYTGNLAHPDTTTAPTAATASAGSPGSATRSAAVDHAHQVSTAAPTNFGRANAAGSSSSLARADHVHDSGDGTFDFLFDGTASLPDADFITVDTTAGVAVINLPASPTINGNCRSWSLKKVSTDTNKITLHPPGTETIEGVNANLDLPNSTATTLPSWTLVYNADNDAWWVF